MVRDVDPQAASVRVGSIQRIILAVSARVIALPLGLTESLMKQRCRGLNLGRTETVKGTRRDADNPDLNLG
jgi:hypothetical protein